jgi:hypothetical protein
MALLVAIVIRIGNRNNRYYKKYFVKGLVVKMLAGIAFALFHTYYFTYGGDTKSYFHDMEVITNYFWDDPLATLGYLAEHFNYLTNEIKSQTIFKWGTKQFFLIRFATIINIIGLNSYWSTTILFSVFSYVGTWQLYLVFAKRYPMLWKQMAWAVLFLPSFIFLGSGIMKDTLGVGFLGVLLYAVNNIYENKKGKLWWLIIMVISAMVIFSVRAYILFGLIPAMLIWIALGVKDKIRNPVMRLIFMPIILVIMVVSVAGSFSILSNYNSRFTTDNVIVTALAYQHWHYVEGQNTSEQHGRGSSYTLGDYDATPIGVMKTFFPAVNVALFRPYFWEVKNPAMAILSIESFAFFLITIYIFLRVGPFGLIRAMSADSFLLMSLIFSIFFSFAVGFSTWNFGALARYKIPALPFFAASLIILNYYANLYRKQRKMGKAHRDAQRAFKKVQVQSSLN